MSGKTTGDSRQRREAALSGGEDRARERGPSHFLSLTLLIAREREREFLPSGIYWLNYLKEPDEPSRVESCNILPLLSLSTFIHSFIKKLRSLHGKLIIASSLSLNRLRPLDCLSLGLTHLKILLDVIRMGTAAPTQRYHLRYDYPPPCIQVIHPTAPLLVEFIFVSASNTFNTTLTPTHHVHLEKLQPMSWATIDLKVILILFHSTSTFLGPNIALISLTSDMSPLKVSREECHSTCLWCDSIKSIFFIPLSHGETWILSSPFQCQSCEFPFLCLTQS